MAGERHAEADERDPDVKTGGLFRRGSRDHDREDRGAREEGQPVPASAPAGHDGASHNGEEGAVQERVHRERDPESGEIHDERIEERRFER